MRLMLALSWLPLSRKKFSGNLICSHTWLSALLQSVVVKASVLVLAVQAVTAECRVLQPVLVCYCSRACKTGWIVDKLQASDAVPAGRLDPCTDFKHLAFNMADSG